jgi:hypothetical protein
MPRLAYLSLDGRLATFDPSECESYPDPKDRPHGLHFDIYRTPDGIWILHGRYSKPLQPWETCAPFQQNPYRQIYLEGVIDGFRESGRGMPESLVRDIEAARRHESAAGGNPRTSPAATEEPSGVPEDEPAPVCPVVLVSQDEAPIVRGTEKPILTPTQYRVVKALVAAFPERLAGDSLARKSEVEDPVGAIDRLRRDKDWEMVLSKPGQAHGGYGIVAKPRKTQKSPETRPRKPRGR